VAIYIILTSINTRMRDSACVYAFFKYACYYINRW